MLGWLNKKFTNFWTKPVAVVRPFITQFDNIAHNIHPGDILLVEGNTRAAQVIKKITQSPWTHVSLYIGRLHDIESEQTRQIIQEHYNPSPNEQLVVESMLGKGNYIDNINVFKNDHIRLCRPYQISHEDIQHIIDYAVAQIGAEYNLRHFFDLGRFMLSAKFIPRRWHSSLFEKDSTQATEEICSGMIAKAFMSVHYPILPTFRENEIKSLEIIHRNPKLFIPADFDHSPYFKIIKFPKFHAYDSPVYHHLPWNDNYMSNDHEGIAESIHSYTTKPDSVDLCAKNDYDSQKALNLDSRKKHADEC